MTPLSLTPVNANVYSVHMSDGAHVGYLKRIGSVWKFKAVGYGDPGGLEPGGGPLTDWHNTVFATPNADEVSAKLCA